MRRSLGLPVGLVALLCSGACKSQNDGIFLQVLQELRPNDTCILTPTNDYVASGYYDPFINGASGYTMHLRVQNNGPRAIDDPLTLDKTQLRSPSNGALINGAEICWAISDGAIPLGEFADGKVIDCDSLPPTQRASIPASGTIPEGTVGLVGMTVFTLDHLQGIFGTDYNPLQIPSIGYRNESLTQDGNNIQRIFRREPLFPGEVGVSPAWGTHPPQLPVRVILRLRLVGAHQGGYTIYSNWFTQAFRICTACQTGSCGVLTTQTCAGACGDISTCPVTALSGEIPDYGNCLPAQGFFPVTCESFGCGPRL